MTDTLRKTAGRYTKDAIIDACFPNDVMAMVDGGVTAFVCHSTELAEQVKQQLEKHQVNIPQQVSLAAVGTTSGEVPYSGNFLDRSEKVSAILQLLADTQSYRPTTLWLTGSFVDKGTLAPVAHTGSMGDGLQSSLSA